MADAILINAGERGVTDLVDIIDRINGNISRQTNGVPARPAKVSSLNKLLL